MDMKLIQKARKTFYKHPAWFKEGNKTVFEAIRYMINCGDMGLDTTARYPSEIPNYNGMNDRKEVIAYLIENEIWDKLVIRYHGKEGGSDKGKMKILTYLYLLKQKQKLAELNIELTDIYEFVKNGKIEDYLSEEGVRDDIHHNGTRNIAYWIINEGTDQERGVDINLDVDSDGETQYFQRLDFTDNNLFIFEHFEDALDEMFNDIEEIKREEAERQANTSNLSFDI
jgi:hypothetical protein